MADENIGYCVKCKKKVEMKDMVEKKSSKGTRMNQGFCPFCGTKVNRLLGKK